MSLTSAYADLKLSEGSSSRRSVHLNVIQQPDHQLCPRWHRIVLLLGWAGNIILLIALIAIGVFALNGNPQRPTKLTETPLSISNTHHCNHDLEEFRSVLREDLCGAGMASLENGSCRMCPVGWLLHENKCYWISTSIQTWNQSHSDCVTKRSHLLVISDGEQQKFIEEKVMKTAWIGRNLFLPGQEWNWIDRSPLNQTQSQQYIPRNKCGVIGKKGIDFDLCTTELYWICQKESVFI